MKAIVIIIAAALAAQGALAQPPEGVSDVDVNTTAASASPLNPPDAAKAIAGARPYAVYDKEVRPDGERTPTDITYENRVLGSFRTVQGAQGPLDGRWIVSGSDGVAIYSLQLTDPGAGEARIEGAWRNLRRNGLGASGFVESVRREADDVVFAFRDGPTESQAEIRLRLAPNGIWVGEAVSGAEKVGVIANRGQGLETASMTVPEWRNPPPPPPVRAKAKAKSKAKAQPKSKNRRSRR